MKHLSMPLLVILFFLCSTLSSCQAIGDIFKAGIWVGVIGVGLVVFLIIYLISRSRK